jgi:tryprostatin B 6-hydroxylase
MLLSKILPSLLREVSLVPRKDLALACCFLGVISHVSYFRRKERDGQAVEFVFALIGIPLTILSLFYATLHITLYESFGLTSVVVGPYIIGLYTSIVVYRLWFHPRMFISPLFPSVPYAPDYTRNYHGYLLQER